MKDIAVSLNGRDAGCYFQTEFINGQVFFPSATTLATTGSGTTNRQVYRVVVNFGALPDTDIKPMPHGISIDPTFSFTRIYATATDPVAKIFLPIPYATETVGDAIELSVDGTNVNIKTWKNRTSFTTCYVVLEYIKQ